MAALPHTKWDEGQRRARKTEQRLLIPTTPNNTGRPSLAQQALLRPWVDMLHFHGVLAWIATKIWLCGGIFSGGGRWSFLGVDNCLIPFDRFAG
ncbi:hypothetical protein HBH52_090650 [Parastagonospora nodorum]|nr:hypothetical protein HBH52_090650 [Parastagonospora nodorum]